MMTDEFDHLRASWTAQTISDGDVTAYRRLWRRGLWKMRARNFADLLLLAILGWTSIESIVRGSWITSALLMAMFMGLGWMQWQSIRLRAVELGAVETNTICLLQHSIARVRARRARTSLALAAIIPGSILGIGVGLSRKTDGLRPALHGRPDWAVPYIQAIASALIVTIIVWLCLAVRRERHVLAVLAERIETERLEQVRDADGGG